MNWGDRSGSWLSMPDRLCRLPSSATYRFTDGGFQKAIGAWCVEDTVAASVAALVWLLVDCCAAGGIILFFPRFLIIKLM